TLHHVFLAADLASEIHLADLATADRGTWERYLPHIAGLVEPGGLPNTASLRAATTYTVDTRNLPSANIDETDLERVLSSDFDFVGGVVDVREPRDQPSHGYTGIVLTSTARARDRTANLDIASAQLAAVP
ncbi:MAG: hypothetical protein ACRDZ2_05690, partial [Ilumatobacteraceae bacterium]